MKDGKPVMENGIPLQQDFVAELPYADMEDPSNPSIAKFADYTKMAEAMNPDKKVPLTGQALKDSTRLARIGESVQTDYAASGKEHASPYFGKMFDKKATGTRSHKNLIVYRYADVLTLLAEAIVREGNTVTPEAVELLNMVHTRAGLPAYTMADFAGADAFLEAVLTERGHELWFEGVRRSDLIRYGRYIEYARKYKQSPCLLYTSPSPRDRG